MTLFDNGYLRKAVPTTRDEIILLHALAKKRHICLNITQFLCLKLTILHETSLVKHAFPQIFTGSTSSWRTAP